MKKDTFDCLPNCPDDFPFYRSTDTPHFICSNEFPCENGKYFYQGNCYTASECIDLGQNFIDTKNICINNCESTNYIEEIIVGFNQCKPACNKYIRNIDGSNDICVEKCPFDENYINPENVCKPSCLDATYNLYYEYEKIEEGGNYIIYKCVDNCPLTHLKRNGQINTDNQCYDNCPEDNYPYLLQEENLCYYTCFETDHPFSLTDTNGKKICSSSCNEQNPNYEETDKICKPSCNNPDTHIIDYNGKCVGQCDLTSTYKFNLNDECKTGCINLYYYP